MRDQVQTVGLNPSDEHAPSRPGAKTIAGAVVLIAMLLLYFNWAGVKGFVGAE